MGPFAAIKSVLSQYATMKGRATPSEFWWWMVTNFLITFMLTFALISTALTNPEASMSGWYLGLCLAAMAHALGTIVPTITVTVRRLHDTGRSGGWYFISFVPLIGPIWLFVLMVLPSSQFDNDYGPSSGSAAWERTDVSNEYVAAFTTDPRLKYMGRMAQTDEELQASAANFEATRKAEISEYYKSQVLGGLKTNSA